MFAKNGEAPVILAILLGVPIVTLILLVLIVSSALFGYALMFLTPWTELLRALCVYARWELSHYHTLVSWVISFKALLFFSRITHIREVSHLYYTLENQKDWLLNPSPERDFDLMTPDFKKGKVWALMKRPWHLFAFNPWALFFFWRGSKSWSVRAARGEVKLLEKMADYRKVQKPLMIRAMDEGRLDTSRAFTLPEGDYGGVVGSLTEAEKGTLVKAWSPVENAFEEFYIPAFLVAFPLPIPATWVAAALERWYKKVLPKNMD